MVTVEFYECVLVKFSLYKSRTKLNYETQSNLAHHTGKSIKLRPHVFK